jgi:isopenicillin-N epimerase
MERQPVQFFVRDLERMLDGARREVALLIGVDEDDLAFVPNATTGVNAVLRSLDFAPGDELLTTDHAYGACRNALAFAAERAGARLVVAHVPFPIGSADEIVDAVVAHVTERTRLALLDHVTSQTALVFPIERLVLALAKRGVDTLVDGAHAPGMLPLNLRRIGAAYYTANCHKWLCAPKGAGVLHVRRDRQARIRPLAVSHGANSPRTDRSRFLLEFDWTGTVDPTPWLCIPAAIRMLGALQVGGFPEHMERNHRLAVDARDRLCSALDVPRPCPDEMLGSMAAVPLPGGGRASAIGSDSARVFAFMDPLQEALVTRFSIEVPIFGWPAPPSRVLRVSAQAYNEASEYDRLAAAIVTVLREEEERA